MEKKQNKSKVKIKKTVRKGATDIVEKLNSGVIDEIVNSNFFEIITKELSEQFEIQEEIIKSIIEQISNNPIIGQLNKNISREIIDKTTKNKIESLKILDKFSDSELNETIAIKSKELSDSLNQNFTVHYLKQQTIQILSKLSEQNKQNKLKRIEKQNQLVNENQDIYENILEKLTKLEHDDVKLYQSIEDSEECLDWEDILKDIEKKIDFEKGKSEPNQFKINKLLENYTLIEKNIENKNMILSQKDTMEKLNSEINGIKQISSKEMNLKKLSYIGIRGFLIKEPILSSFMESSMIVMKKLEKQPTYTKIKNFFNKDEVKTQDSENDLFFHKIYKKYMIEKSKVNNGFQLNVQLQELLQKSNVELSISVESIIENLDNSNIMLNNSIEVKINQTLDNTLLKKTDENIKDIHSFQRANSDKNAIIENSLLKEIPLLISDKITYLPFFKTLKASLDLSISKDTEDPDFLNKMFKKSLKCIHGSMEYLLKKSERSFEVTKNMKSDYDYFIDKLDEYEDDIDIDNDILEGKIKTVLLDPNLNNDQKKTLNQLSDLFSNSKSDDKHQYLTDNITQYTETTKIVECTPEEVKKIQDIDKIILKNDPEIKPEVKKSFFDKFRK